MNPAGPASSRELSSSERQFVGLIQDLGFGRFEFLRIEHGQLILDPWPPTVRHVKFASDVGTGRAARSDEFELKRQFSELFEYVRSVESGEIRCLEIRHSLPFSMEIATGGQCG
jgi:hypothetical protein